MYPRPIEFLRKKDYVLEKELGQGACGQTVVIYDPIIDERFVCKKFSPFDETWKEELFSNFIREIKLLYLLNHPNIVRVFNYYLYPEKHSGYILMELIQGTDIENYLKKYPENVNEIFSQAIDGFSHLEESNILHRDIRPFNLMVNESGIVKIIDFGFGKQALIENDFDKSISLNWWCEPPTDFDKGEYSHSTEVYFVGKLFQKIISDLDIHHFTHISLLKKMCTKSPVERISSFIEVRKKLLSDKFLDISFEESEREIYKNFSNSLFDSVSKIENNSRYYDVESVQTKLEECYKKVMLEELIPKNSLVSNCFINGTYYSNSREDFYVYTLKVFVDFFRSCSREKKNIVLGNLQTKLDSIPHYDQEPEFDDDIPF